jgi:hypothetical protein
VADAREGAARGLLREEESRVGGRRRFGAPLGDVGSELGAVGKGLELRREASIFGATATPLGTEDLLLRRGMAVALNVFGKYGLRTTHF